MTGATRVADQIKILTRFIYLLGGVAKGLEGVDDAARRNEASPAVMEQAETKQGHGARPAFKASGKDWTNWRLIFARRRSCSATT